ncbi:uncharacterized protein LOC110738379 [Chenopodium quinoa]|uniref:uncharacterized protein LOC110738379 n=1 Tax=Chenopodium quinoa TaxID=63459 RepID=UPI000B799EDC|nr:uncharacterized protein LOC110738379 [Chenopodium quinoa]XP_021774453.1 uncharacterized protein LOC110738379 [Chenopodium quinoa]
MCRQSIRILDLNHVANIPQCYILNRWRKDIMRKDTCVKVFYHDPNKTLEVKRHNILMNVFKPICEEVAMVDDPTVGMVLNCLENLKTEVHKCSKRKLDQTIPCTNPGDGAETIDLSSDNNCNNSSVKKASPSKDNPHKETGLNEQCNAAVKNPVPKKKGCGRPKGLRNKAKGAKVGFKKRNGKKQTLPCSQPEDVAEWTNSTVKNCTPSKEIPHSDDGGLNGDCEAAVPDTVPMKKGHGRPKGSRNKGLAAKKVFKKVIVMYLIIVDCKC